MNVFYTNKCPIEAALDHNKVHQIKMICEYSQLLSTAHFELDGNVVGYKPTHKIILKVGNLLVLLILNLKVVCKSCLI